MVLNRGGPLSKLVGGTIGLAKEYSADKKQRKANENQTNQPPSAQHQQGNTVNVPQHKLEDDSDDSSLRCHPRGPSGSHGTREPQERMGDRVDF